MPTTSRSAGHSTRGRTRLVAGCLLASYITFDLSPELALTPARPAAGTSIAAIWPAGGRAGRRGRPRARARPRFDDLLCSVWPAMQKMKRRDEKYRAARERAFTTEAGPALPARAVDRRACPG